MTSYSLEYSCTPFRYIRSVEEHRKVLLEHLRGTSFCIQPVRELLGASGRIGVAVQNSWVIELWLPNHFTFCWCLSPSTIQSFSCTSCGQIFSQLSCFTHYCHSTHIHLHPDCSNVTVSDGLDYNQEENIPWFDNDVGSLHLEKVILLHVIYDTPYNLQSPSVTPIKPNNPNYPRAIPYNPW